MKNTWEQDKKKTHKKPPMGNNEKYKLVYFVPYISFVIILIMMILEIKTHPY
jgi:hypothetical protein